METLSFLLLLLAASLPLTIFLGACAGLVWMYLDRLPGWCFLAALAGSVVLAGFAAVWGQTLDTSDFRSVLAEFLLLNALMTCVATAGGWASQRFLVRRGPVHL